MANVFPSDLTWRKSSFSASGNCVEVATVQDDKMVFIRDSKNSHGAILAIPFSAWQKFIQAIR
jgi:Domain of unknown function (DUF397)